jgi:trehalose 6-phosphate phosphatase
MRRAGVPSLARRMERLWFNALMAENGTEGRPPLLGASDALYLDFDGTLAGLAPRPDGVSADDALRALLERLCARQGGALALVTGRRLEALDAILGGPRYAGAGLHGLEWRVASGRTISPSDPAAARRYVSALRERFGSDPRIVVEDKGAAVALHFRQAPERAKECIGAMEETVAKTDFEILRGHAVVEARPRGADKGAALRALAGHAPFKGRRPVFVGDDVTDEDGFRAAQDAGGYGVKVGPGPTAARYRIAGVDAVRDWLAASVAALGSGAAS